MIKDTITSPSWLEIILHAICAYRAVAYPLGANQEVVETGTPNLVHLLCLLIITNSAGIKYHANFTRAPKNFIMRISSMICTVFFGIFYYFLLLWRSVISESIKAVTSGSAYISIIIK